MMGRKFSSLIIVFLTFALTLSFSACVGGNTDDTTAADNSESTDESAGVTEDVTTALPDDTTKEETTVTEETTRTPETTEAETTAEETTEEQTTAEETTDVSVRKFSVCIDAGHQIKGMPELEPNGPGSTTMKSKLTSGTQGVATRIPEYQLNLDVSLLLKEELIRRGYDVVMIRENNDCPLSNADRALVANESGADIFVRIHANGSSNPEVKGALCCAPTVNNPYLTSQNIDESIRLSQLVVDSFCLATGANNQGLYKVDTMTGINWCTIPVTIVEMGYMSNADEDRLMATEEYRAKMVQGIADGIDAYFEVKE